LPPLLTEGSRLRARYKIVKLLSHSRLRNIYIAEDQHQRGKHWAIRQMQPVGIDSADRSWLLGQFEAEARILSSLEHPSLPKLVDFFVEENYLYVIREFVQGLDLQVILSQKGGRLGERDSLQVGLALTDLMGYLLRKKLPPVMFRELSLANLVFTPEGQTKLIDFGFSRLFQRQARMGSPDYAAPEQFSEDAEIDARTLVYNVGAMLYHLVTGHNPGTTPFSLPPLWQLNSSLGEKAGQVILKATQNDPNLRFNHPADMAKAIAVALASKSKPPKISDRVRKGGTQRLSKASKVPVRSGSGGVVDFSAPSEEGGVSFLRIFLAGFVIFVLMALACGYLYVTYLD